MKSAQKQKRLIIALSILSCILFASLIFVLYRNNYFTILKQMASTSAYDYKSNAQYTQRQTLFEKLPEKKADIVFIGDSITARCEWQEFFPERIVLNRGIDSDVTAGVLNRLDVIIDAEPKQIFLMIGINDIRQQIPETITVSNYAQIITALKEALPDTELYIQSILPIGSQTGMDTSKVLTLNEQLKELASNHNLTYVDLYTLLADETDHLPLAYSVDGVHLTGDGYQIWIDGISQYIK